MSDEPQRYATHDTRVTARKDGIFKTGTMHDIITYNNTLYVAQRYIIDKCNVGSDYIRVAKTRARKGSPSWQHDDFMGKCYFSFAHLPLKVASDLPPAHELANMANEYHDDIASIVNNAIYTRFKVFLKACKTAEMAKSVAVIFEAANYCKVHNISFSKSEFFEKLAKEIEVQGIKYLPITWRNLRDKIQEHTLGEDLTEVVKVKNLGNSNASIFSNNELIKSWLIELGESQKNYSYSFIFRKLRTICEQQSISKYPSTRWVSEFLRKPETQILISNRFGANSRFNSKFRGYTPTASALFAGDCWDIDGTRVNIIDHKASFVKNGQKIVKNKFLYIVVVRDVMSGMPLGWEYCYEENHDVIINALAMAVRNTGYLPYEIRYDKFPGHNHQDWMRIENELHKIGVVLTQTVKAEGKAHIERWWGTLQSVFMAESDYYYGEGIRSTRKYAHRAKEYVAEMRKKAQKSGFDFNAACDETDKIINAYINTNYSHYSRKYSKLDKSPVELHNECTKPYVYEVQANTFAFLFGLQKQVSPRNFMIQTQINGATYYYGIEDYDLISQHTGKKLLNCFDYEDLSEVHLYTLEGDFLGSFAQIEPAQQYGPNKSLNAVGTMKKIEKTINNEKCNRVAEILTKKFTAEKDDTSYSEMDAMLGGRIGKHDYEDAESAMLQEFWDEDEVTVNIRKNY